MAGDGGAAQRLALIVATSAYEDDGLAQLVSPAHDAAALAGVLANPAIGGFAVTSVLDAPSGQISQTIEDFAAERDRGDLLLLYLSCHGLKDEQGRLYFAARDTRRDRLLDGSPGGVRQRRSVRLPIAPQGSAAGLLLQRRLRQGPVGQGRPFRSYLGPLRRVVWWC